MSVQMQSANFIELIMYTTFTFEVRLPGLNEQAWAALINNLDALGFALTGYIIDDERYENTDDQEKRLVPPAVILEQLTRFLMHVPGNGKVFTLLTAYQDTTIFMRWSLDKEDVIFSWSFNNGDEYHYGDVWRKYFSTDENSKKRLYAEDDDYFYDNARYARLLLDVLEPIGIKSFNLRGQHFQVYEPFAAGSMVAVIGDTQYYNFNQDLVYQLLDNILLNRFFFVLSPSDDVLPRVDEAQKQLNQQLEDKSYAVLYIKQEDALIAQLIVNAARNHIVLIPQEDDSKPSDTRRNKQWYARLLVGICEHYPIWQIKTNGEADELKEQLITLV